MIGLIRRTAGAQWAQFEVRLPIPQKGMENPSNSSNEAMQGDAAKCWLVFDTSLLDATSIDTDDALLQRLQPLAEQMLTTLSARPQSGQTMREMTSKLIQGGSACIEDVAKALTVSPRTLQRRLEAEGTSFGEVWDESRRQVACKHLRNPKIAIKEVAYMLGFSEPSTFYRAFRRWTGATPMDYRRSVAA